MEEPNSATVLVVDDDARVRSLAVQILERGGDRVWQAANADDALAVLEDVDGAVDLLLADVMLPAINGADLAAAVRKRHRRVRVVFMSGFGEDDLEVRGAEEVGTAYITKPFSPEVLRLMVEGALAE